jgi:hypothetical protein
VNRVVVGIRSPPRKMAEVKDYPAAGDENAASFGTLTAR